MKLKQMAIAVSLALGGYATRNGLTVSALAAEMDAATHEALPESQRGWYVKAGDKFKLDLSKVDLEDTSGLKTALEKERTAVKDAKRKAKEDLEALATKYKDIDPEKYKEIMGQFENAEEAELLKQGAAGITKILDKRTEKLRKDFEKRELKLIEERDGALEVASTFMERVLDNHVRAAAAKAGVHPGAVDDVLLRARTMFSLSDDGNPVQFEGEDESKTMVMGKDGKTPFSPDEWLEGMKEAAPHWFPAAGSGGGAGGGGKKGTGGAKTMKRAAFDALDAAGRAAAMAEKVTVVD